MTIIQDKTRTLSELVVDLIRRDIVEGLIAPNERLKVADLAKRYDVGHMPVRQALQQLDGEGLVILTAHRGAIVRSVDKNFVYNMYEIRRALEVMMVASAVRLIRADKLAMLEAAKVRYEAAAAKGSQAEMLQCNVLFHNIINQAGQNEEAARILDNGWDLLNAIRTQVGYSPSRVEQIIDDHRMLYTALEQGNAPLAVEIADRHCVLARDAMLSELAVLWDK